MNRVQQLCEEKGVDLFEIMLDIVHTGKLKGVRKRLPADQRLMILKEITQYAYPKLASMKHELDVGDGNSLTIEWDQSDLFGEDDSIEGESEEVIVN